MVAAETPTGVTGRLGRWLPDYWCRYVFGTAEELEHLSRAMVMADYTLAATLEDFRASAPRGSNSWEIPNPGTDVDIEG